MANAVIAYRSARSLSQRALAERLGWKPSQVARLEMGEHNPSMETLAYLAKALGLRFAMEVGPSGRRVRRRRSDAVEDITTAQGSRILVRAG